MERIDTMKGSLEFVLGSGWMSRYEAARLAPGAVVRTTRMAGTGYELRFNGERIADASGAVIGQGESARLCAQLESLDRRPGIAPEPARGAELTELLPFSVILGKAQASVAELGGLGKTSVVDLGIEAREKQEAELVLAGVHVARGVASVVGENMALRVTECLLAPGETPPFRTSGALVDPRLSPEKVKDYDFRMPDCFTKIQLEALASLHGDFLRSLAALSAAGGESLPGGVELVKVDQLNFTEFAESLAVGELIVAAPCSPSPGRPRIPEEEWPLKDCLGLSGRPGFQAETAAAQARGLRNRPSGGAVLAAGAMLSASRDIVFAALRDAWKSYGALSPFPAAEFRREKAKPALALKDYADEYEMVALVSFTVGGSGRLDIAYPLRTIERSLKALTA